MGLAIRSSRGREGPAIKPNSALEGRGREGPAKWANSELEERGTTGPAKRPKSALEGVTLLLEPLRLFENFLN